MTTLATASRSSRNALCPNVSNEDVRRGKARASPEQLPIDRFTEHGRWQASPDPFVILHGAHGYFVQFCRGNGTSGHQKGI